MPQQASEQGCLDTLSSKMLNMGLMLLGLGYVYAHYAASTMLTAYGR